MRLPKRPPVKLRPPAQHQIPDLAILDIRMPGISGSNWRGGCGIPIAFLDGCFCPPTATKKWWRRQSTKGGSVTWSSPVDVSQLVPAIEAALARARDLQALGKAKDRLEEALKGGRDTPRLPSAF